MKFEKVLVGLIGVLITVPSAMGQPDTTGFPDLPDNASVGHRMTATPVRRWEKTKGDFHPRVTHISTEGLVGYWPFNGNAVDESGNENNGTVFGAVLTEDRFESANSAFFFDGVDDYISAGDSVTLEMDTSMSMMVWFNPHFTHTSLDGTILSRSGEYQIGRDVTNQIQYQIYNTNPGYNWVPIGYEAPPDEWTHVAVTYDAGLATVYVNGTPFFGYSGSGIIRDGYLDFDELRFGGRQHLVLDQQFHGAIDDIRVYNRPISAEEVLDIYNEIPSSQLPPITVEVDIDSLLMFVPAEGDTFAYAITFTNNTSDNQTFNYWTKILRPIGDPIDPLLGPLTLKLEPNSTVIIDTAQLPIPYNAVTGEYALVTYVGTFDADTIDADTAAFYKLPEIPCEDIDRFQARCRPGGIMQARIILTDASHTGDVAEFTIDGVPYEATVGANRIALLSLAGFNIGFHDVELTEPPDCYALVTVTCPEGLGKDADDFWVYDLVEDDDESREVPTATALLGNYPNPFNPSTTMRYALSENAHVTLTVYNMLGQVVKTVVNDYRSEGYYEVLWDGRHEFGSNAASGIYIYRMVAGNFVQTKRMLFLK